MNKDCKGTLPLVADFLGCDEEIEGAIARFMDDPLLQQVYRIDLSLLNFFSKCYASKHVSIARENGGVYFDLREVTGLKLSFVRNESYPSKFFSWRLNYPYDRTLQKEVLVRYCDYDSVEGIIPNTIYTSRLNLNERFYNIIMLGDYEVKQVDKMVYDKAEDKFVEYPHSEFFIPDSEIRLGEEIQAIKKFVPLEQRSKYCRN